MKIQTVTVECHEKRAHPSEMGHRDASVSYTAQVEKGDDAGRVVEQLQEVAYQQVADELDKWIAEIKTREAQDKARNDLHWIVDRLENRLPMQDDLTKFEKHLATLPKNEHPEWRAKLKAAEGEFMTRITGDLDRIVERVGRRGATARDESDVDELMERLPESERQGYIDKMRDAIAAYELSIAPVTEEAATQVESQGSGDKEEVPF